MSACKECEDISRADPSFLVSVFFSLSAASEVHDDTRTGGARVKTSPVFFFRLAMRSDRRTPIGPSDAKIRRRLVINQKS